MEVKKGSLSINSDNLFPIIKKWLYSDHDIFIRELISNGSDAITKLKKLALMGEFNESEGNKYRIDVSVSSKNKTIKFSDNGLGMTESEVEEYINQIAFSGARDFIEKYKDKASDDQIIGHFGLGFYSAFMVADKVSIDTLSYREGAKAVHWVSEGGTEYEMSGSARTGRGTEITLYLNDSSHEFSNEYRVREVLDKYCSFMPVEIYLHNEDEVKKTDTADTENAGENDAQEKPAGEKPLNDISPLWNRHPNECSEEDYKSFYRKVFMDYKEPLFWIHLNMDYPFNLKGILYFPKINTEYDSLEGTIKLYNNQVFIADNIKEVIPEFLMLLKGVIDCPDLPLNVSRSALQNDGFVKKISDYISKKVADKLSGMCKTDRENYEKYWDDISPFVKYGCLRDEKFADKMNDYVLFKNLEGNYLTIKDIVPETEDEAAENADAETENSESSASGNADMTDSDAKEDKKPETKVYYVTDEKEQGQYISMFKSAGKSAYILSHNIDAPFISQLEMKNEGLKFLRIDADISDDMKSEEAVDEESRKSHELLTENIKKAIGNDKLNIEIHSLKDENVAAVITVSEESRRMQDMMKQYAMPGTDMSIFGQESETLVLNSGNSLVKRLAESPDWEMFSEIANQLYDLAALGHSQLSPERMSRFIARSNSLMMKL